MADSIAMTQIGDRTYLDDFTKSGNVVQFSPDGSRFAVVVQKGNLQNDTVEFRLLVFKTDDAFTGPHARVVAALATSSNREAISHVKWLSDNDTLVFLGEQPGEVPQLYRVVATTGHLEKLTNSPTSVVAYSMSDRGNAFVYVADVQSRPKITNAMREQGFVVTSEEWKELYANTKPTFEVRKEIFVKTPSLQAPASLGVLDLYPDTDGIDLKLSPDARYAIINAYVTSPPRSWNDYWDYRVLNQEFDRASNCTSRVAVSICPMQYLLVDLQEKSISPLLDAPVMKGASNPFEEAFAWTAENSVLLVNAYLPLASAVGNERSSRAQHTYAAEVILPSKEIRAISERSAPLDVDSLTADPARDRFVSQSFSGSGARIEFRKESGKWMWDQLKPSEPASTEPFSVTLDQGPNTSPRLVANNLKSKRKAVVLDLNPQFAKLAFGKVKTFHWTTRSKDHLEGLLYYPVGYVAGRRYPVVLQTHGSTRDRFWMDGPFTTAMAAQPLAGRGFFVLQMPLGDIYNKGDLEKVTKILGTAEEGSYFMDTFESAIDELDREGLIDRNRVGLTGFSRTVYHVWYTLTHSHYHFAAAVIADGANFGYGNCVFFPVFQPTCEKVNGGVPYGATLSNWAKRAPMFRLDEIQTPMLLQAILAPIGEWEFMSGLRWLKKPVEMENFYPEGSHVLVRPRQRLLSQGSAVDWFSFWIQGYEDPDPAKAAQYGRWRKLRALEARTASGQHSQAGEKTQRTAISAS